MDNEFERQAIALRNEWKTYLSSLGDENILQILDRNVFDNLIKIEQAIIKELPKIKEFMHNEIEVLYNKYRDLRYIQKIKKSMEKVKIEVNKIM